MRGSIRWQGLDGTLWVQRRGESASAWDLDRPIPVGDCEISARQVAWSQIATPRTLTLGEPLTIVIERNGELVAISTPRGQVVLRGLTARILNEVLGESGISWVDLALRCFGPIDDWGKARNRIDVALSRLRTRLKEMGLPPRLLSTDGQGSIHFRLGPLDRIERR
jgi:hypothetical protein